jgi:ankyrin repeat protein
MLRVILHAGAPINMATPHGETALYKAAQGGQLDAIRLLVAGRADPNIANSRGATAVAVASEQGHDRIVRFLGPGRARGAHAWPGRPDAWALARCR